MSASGAGAAPPTGSPALQRLRRALTSRATAQTALYVGSSALVSLLSGVAMALLARELAPTRFGSFSFAISFLTFAGLFFEFGLFAPAARRMARSADRERREFIGASLILFVPIGLAFSAAVFGLSFVVDDVFHAGAAMPLRLVAGLAFVYPFVHIGLQICQGADRLHVNSFASGFAQVAFVASLIGLMAAGIGFDVSGALLLRCASLLVGLVIVVAWLRPVLRGTAARVRAIVSDALSWGRHVYVGRILSIGTYEMDVFMVAAFADVQSVGYYTLATAIANVVGLPISGMAITLFPRMTTQPRLNASWLAIAWGVGLAGAAAIWLLAPPVVDLVFTHRYAPVAALAVPLALGQAVRGATSIYNSFLSAHARGRELRNTGLILTGSNLAFNFLLIPPYGAMGAAWASLLALTANLVGYIVFYRRSVDEPGLAR